MSVELVVGMEMIATNGLGARIVKIERLTPTQIIAGGQRWRRVGDDFFGLVGGSAWSQSSLVIGTPEGLAAHREASAFRKALNIVRGMRPRKLTPDQVYRIAAIVAEVPPQGSHPSR